MKSIMYCNVYTIFFLPLTHSSAFNTCKAQLSSKYIDLYIVILLVIDILSIAIIYKPWFFPVIKSIQLYHKWALPSRYKYQNSNDVILKWRELLRVDIDLLLGLARFDVIGIIVKDSNPIYKAGRFIILCYWHVKW